MAGEFDLIKSFFARTSGIQDTPSTRAAVLLGVNDDCAVFKPQSGYQIATSTDLLIEDRHFFADVDPYLLGHKTLAVNLSDLAAMGAKPIACLLGIALPRVDSQWLEAFSAGFYTLAEQFQCPLIGGDTTSSNHSICLSVTVFGQVKPPYLQRNLAQVNDDIWVSGLLGAAHVALQLLQMQHQGQRLSAQQLSLLADTRSALEKPIARVELGMALQNVAHAMIDISDGLVQDLGHITEASQVSAHIYEAQLPVAPCLAQVAPGLLREALLGGGDVYELCFTAPPETAKKIQKISRALHIPLTKIGQIHEATEPQFKVKIYDRFAEEIEDFRAGFDHFG